MTQKISELPVTTLETGAELVPVVQGGVTKHSTITKIAAYVKTLFAVSSGSSLVGFQQAGTGAVAETTQNALQNQIVWDYQFGAVGNGVTDDTTALTNFWNSAIANPQVIHKLRPLTYLISGALPTINVSDVLILGAGAQIHDVGSLISGTVLKCGGAAGYTAVTISSISGASNQKIGGIQFAGIGIDCNSGNAAYGIAINSLKESVIDVCVANASTGGIGMNVVAALGEARDTQKNKIRLQSRQIEANGTGIILNGDASANVSMNEFWIESENKNGPGILCFNSDNNDWYFVRVNKAGGGTATEGVTLLGGTSALVSSRNERFHFYTGNLPIHVYGTGSYAVASLNNRIDVLDVANSTPSPLVDTGASMYWNSGNTPFGDTPWLPYTPIITSGTGTLTTVSATGKYLQRGKFVFVEIVISITTNGTGASYLNATLPIAEALSVSWIFAGKEPAVTGYSAVGVVGASSSNMTIQKYDGTYLGGNGYLIILSGFYAIA